jgi:hypothetical protein
LSRDDGIEGDTLLQDSRFLWKVGIHQRGYTAPITRSTSTLQTNSQSYVDCDTQGCYTVDL